MRHFPLILCVCLAAALTLVATPSYAYVRPHLIITGVLRSVNQELHTAEIVPSDGKAPRPFRWTHRTKFYVGLQETSSRALRDGAAVRVVMHHPLFGGRYASKVNMPNGR